MTLIKRNKAWHYQTKIEGKTFHRSTGQTDRRQAERVAEQFRVEARLRKKQPEDWPKLSQAMNREVARIETDTSSQQAERALFSFAAFLAWLKRDPHLTEITHELLEEYQRYRLRGHARATVAKDINFLLRMLRENHIQLPRLRPKLDVKQRFVPFPGMNLFNFSTTSRTISAPSMPRFSLRVLDQRNLFLPPVPSTNHFSRARLILRRG